MISGSIGQIVGLDVGVIVLYFVVVMVFGLWSSLKNRGSVGGYFLADRSMHFLLVGCSLFSTNIGSGHFIGLAGSGVLTGITKASYELNAMFILAILGWLFVPVYIASGVSTLPEYMQKRFGGQRIRIYLAVLSLSLSIFTKISVDLYAGALFIKQAIHWDIYFSILMLLIIAALFTITGGLTAVMWTDFIQTIIMIIGALYLMGTSFKEIGGYQKVMDTYLLAAPMYPSILSRQTKNASESNVSSPDANKNACLFPPSNSLHLFHPPNDPILPWPGIFGLALSSIWYWCSDQVIVQRVLASKNLSHAKAGCLIAGFFKFLPLWMIIFPGMIARIKDPACVGAQSCAHICGSSLGCSNLAYPNLVINFMPAGARGLMLAVMMSALMSSLSSVFNSSSTLFTLDIWIKIRKKATDTELMIVGRVFVLVMMAVSIAWIPILENNSELYDYMQSVTSFLSPPISAVYVLAVFWSRATENGVFWGLTIGLIIGMIRFIWEHIYPTASCSNEKPDLRPDIIKNVHHLYFGTMLFGLVFIIVIAISFMTKKVENKYLIRLLFWNRHCKEKRIEMEHPKYELQQSNVYIVQQNESNVSIELPNEETDSVDDENKSCFKTLLNWLCGIEKVNIMSEEEKKAYEEKHTSLHEDRHQYWYNNIGLCFLTILTLATFIYFA